MEDDKGFHEWCWIPSIIEPHYPLRNCTVRWNKRTGNYGTYSYLLKKYKKRHVMEKWSANSYCRESKERRVKKYLHESEYIMDSMKLVGGQRKQLRHMVMTIPLKRLHRRADYKTIILCLCIYVRKVWSNNSFRWRKYGIVKEYGLEYDTLLTVMMNLCDYYNQKIPIPTANTEVVDL